MLTTKVDINTIKENQSIKALLDDLAEATFKLMLEKTRKYGQVEPLLITKDTEVLVDNEQLQIFRQLGYKEVECRVMENLTDAACQQEFSILELLATRQLSAQEIARLYERLKELNPSAWGGDRKSSDFQERKNCQHETLKKKFASALNISPRTLDNIRAAVKQAEKRNDTKALEQLRSPKASTRILRGYKQLELHEGKIPLSVNYLAKEFKKQSQTTTGPPSDTMAFLAEDNIIVLPKTKYAQDIIQEKYVARQVQVPQKEIIESTGIVANRKTFRNLKKVLGAYQNPIIKMVRGMLCVETDNVIFAFRTGEVA